ncbi:MAG: hypothetical protein LUC88_04740 [Prevotella sp.]|nr:hypothetical protein [Prevotella sp.]
MPTFQEARDNLWKILICDGMSPEKCEEFGWCDHCPFDTNIDFSEQDIFTVAIAALDDVINNGYMSAAKEEYAAETQRICEKYREYLAGIYEEGQEFSDTEEDV